MAAVTDEAVTRRLASLADNIESIQTIALWLSIQFKQTTRVIDVWQEELRKGELTGLWRRRRSGWELLKPTAPSD